MLTPAPRSAASMSFWEAVFADTFAVGWVVALVAADVAVGAAVGEGGLSCVVVEPPQAAKARTSTLTIKESLALLRISFPSVAFGATLPIHSNGGSSTGKERRMTSDEQKREQLLDQAAAVLARRGVVDTSLRSLAAELGTSARMLVY